MPIEKPTSSPVTPAKIADVGRIYAFAPADARKLPTAQTRQPGALGSLKPRTSLDSVEKPPVALNIFTVEKYPIKDIKRELDALTNPDLSQAEVHDAAVRLSVYLDCKPELDRLAYQPTKAGLIDLWQPPAGLFARNTPRPAAGKTAAPGTRPAAPTEDSRASDTQTARVLGLSPAELLDALARIGPRQSPQLTTKILQLLEHSLANKPEFRAAFKDRDTIGSALQHTAKNQGPAGQ
ncbi:MAG: hypothetical protein EOO28_08175 [Comamonadaceae bacterium]|nr:MAG: hypothetical protein EOO28_08175 [Comamonadaceae bacterium]